MMLIIFTLKYKTSFQNYCQVQPSPFNFTTDLLKYIVYYSCTKSI